MQYEYKVVPAPAQGKKAKGLKTTADRFAHALEAIMNPLGRDGWDYVRTDTLPCEERTGLTGRTTTYQNMLVFRRALPTEAETKPEVSGLLAPPAPASPTPAAQPAAVQPQAPAPGPTHSPAPAHAPAAAPVPPAATAPQHPSLGPATAAGMAAPIGPATRTPSRPVSHAVTPPALDEGVPGQPEAAPLPETFVPTPPASPASAPEAPAAARAAAAALRSYRATRPNSGSGVAAE